MIIKEEHLSQQQNWQTVLINQRKNNVSSISVSEKNKVRKFALTLLTNLGYQFIPLSECAVKRGNRSLVILPDVLRDVLKHKTFSFMGKDRQLSKAAMDKIVHELANPAMNEGLKAANEKLYNALTYGINVTEFVEVKPIQPLISLIGRTQTTTSSIFGKPKSQCAWHGQTYSRYCLLCKWPTLGGD